MPDRARFGVVVATDGSRPAQAAVATGRPMKTTAGAGRGGVA